MKLPRLHRRRDLDARLADARRRADEAAEEAALSLARQAGVREHVVRPLRKYAEDNNFAALLRASIRQGWEQQ